MWAPKHWNLMWLWPTSPKSMLVSDGAPRSEAEAEDAKPQKFATSNPECYHVVYHCLINHYGFLEFPTFRYAGYRRLAEPRAYLGTLREAGDDDEHFNGPAGVTTDAGGRIYVCDSGNHRIKVFRHDGLLLGVLSSYSYQGKRLPLKHCAAVLVEPATDGRIFVTVDAEANGRPVKRLLMLKPFAAGDGMTLDTVDLNRLAGFNLALDTSAKPHLLWTTKGAGRGTFTRIEVFDDRFGAVKHFGGTRRWRLMQVTSLDVDENHRLYCAEQNALYQRLLRVDGNTGELEHLPDWPQMYGYNSFVKRLRLTPDGALIYNSGKEIGRYDRGTGAPVKFAGTGSASIASNAENFQGFRGCAVDREGNIYALTHTKRPNTARGGGWNRLVEVWNPDGTPKSADLLGRIPGPLRDLFVDRTGCVYLFTGSTVYRYRPGEGRLWKQDGFSYSRYDGCGCMTPKMCVDDDLYAWVPDQRQVRVRVLDANANLVADIGSYGNRDCRGRFGPTPEPAVPLQNPIAVAVRNDRLYVADYGNLRIVRVDVGYALERELTFRNEGTVLRGAEQ
jgi:sugar lactone lactonase YvrE